MPELRVKPGRSGDDLTNPALGAGSGPSLGSFLQFFRSAQDQGRLGVEDFADFHQCGVGFIPLLLFNRLAGGGKGFDAVAGIEPRRIDLVLEPRAAGEAIGTGELAFTFDERLVHMLERGVGQRRRSVGLRFFQRLLVARRAAGERVRGVIERGKVQVRRRVFLGGGTSGSLGSMVAVKTPSSISWLRSRTASCLSFSNFFNCSE